MVRIFPNPKGRLIAIGIVILCLIGSILFILNIGTNPESTDYDVNGDITIIASFIIVSLFTLLMIYLRRGFKLEIDEKGINYGKRYYGPFNKNRPFEKWNKCEWKNKDNFMHWEEITAIHIGNRGEWAAKYSFIASKYVQKDNSSDQDAILKKLGLPEIYYMKYITVETNRGDNYSYHLTLRDVAAAIKTISDFGKEKLIVGDKNIEPIYSDDSTSIDF